jgi:blue light- and temperature-responsive anti-repressor
MIPPQLYRIVYCSRNAITGGPAQIEEELEHILDSARRNNSRRGITGALLYNGGSFAQILEGPLDKLELVFEAIQSDERHEDVNVIENGPIAARMFPNWSMAFAASRCPADTAQVTEAFHSVFSGSIHGTNQLLNLLNQLVVEEGAWALTEDALEQSV